MGRTQDVRLVWIEEFTGHKVQRRADVGAGIDVYENLAIASDDHETFHAAIALKKKAVRRAFFDVVKITQLHDAVSITCSTAQRKNSLLNRGIALATSIHSGMWS